MTNDIKKQYQIRETSFGGQSYRVFKDNYNHLAEVYGCFAEYADRELVIYQDQRLSYADMGLRAARLAAGCSGGWLAWLWAETWPVIYLLQPAAAHVARGTWCCPWRWAEVATA